MDCTHEKERKASVEEIGESVHSNLSKERLTQNVHAVKPGKCTEYSELRRRERR